MTRAGRGEGLARGTLLVVLAEGLAVPAGIVTAAYLARRLGPDGYGAFGLAVSVALTIEWTIASFLTRASVKAVAEADDWRPAAAATLRLHLVLGLAAGAALWAASGAIAAVLNEPRLVWALRLLAVEVPVASAAAACRSVLTGRRRFAARAAAGALRWVARPALIVALVAAGWSLAGALAGSVGAALVGLAAAQAFARVPAARPGAPIRALLDTAVPLFALALSLRLVDRLGLFALTALGAPTAEAGWYAAGQAFAIAPGIFAMSFSPLLLAAAARALADGDRAAADRLAAGALRAAAILVPFAVLLAASAREIVALVFGPAFAPVAGLAPPLVGAAVAVLVISVTSTLLTAIDRARLAAACVWPVLPLAAAGHALVVPVHGAPGAAWVTCAATAAGALASLVALAATWGVRPPAGTLARSLAVSAVAGAAALAWPAPGAWLLVKGAVLGAGIAGALAAFGEFGRDDVAALRAALRGGGAGGVEGGAGGEGDGTDRFGGGQL